MSFHGDETELWRILATIPQTAVTTTSVALLGPPAAVIEALKRPTKARAGAGAGTSPDPPPAQV